MHPLPSPRRWLAPAVLLFLWGAAGAVSAQAPREGILGESVQATGQISPEARAKIQRLEKQLAADGNNYRVAFDLGNLYYDAGELEQARAMFSRAEEINPKYLEAIVNLGSVLSDLDRKEEAVETLERALALDPEDCKARSNLGNVFYSLERYPDAMYEYQRAIKIDPRCHTALYNIAVAFADAGLFREAIQWWQKVIQVAPGTDAALNAKENIQILDRFVTAPIPSRRDRKVGGG